MHVQYFKGLRKHSLASKRMSAIRDLKPCLEVNAELLLSACLTAPLNPAGLQHDLTSHTDLVLGATNPGHVCTAPCQATFGIPSPLRAAPC